MDARKLVAVFFGLAFGAAWLLFIAGIIWWALRRFKRKRDEWLAFGHANGLGEEPRRGNFSILTGLRGDCAVRLKAEATQHGRSNDPNHLQIDLRVELPNLPAGIAVYRETALSKLGKLFHTQDIEIGDAAFDAIFKVKGDDPEFVKRYLADGGRFQALMAGTAGPLAEAALDEQGLKLHCDARLDRPDELEAVLLRLDALARLAAGLR